MPGFNIFYYASFSRQNIRPPATLLKIKVEIKIKTVAKSKILCHCSQNKKPRIIGALFIYLTSLHGSPLTFC